MNWRAMALSIKKSAARKSHNNTTGNTSNGAGGITAAFADRAKRSTYYQKIEKDCIKYRSSILEIQSALVENLKFHQHVEDHLENLSDERQVLLRFEDFPFEKLETLRIAAGTYHQLEGIVSTLKGGRFTAPSSKMPVIDQLEKIESYFKKIEKKVNGIERDRERHKEIPEPKFDV